MDLFLKAKHKWRIINETLLAEYAYVLRYLGNHLMCHAHHMPLYFTIKPLFIHIYRIETKQLNRQIYFI